MGSFSVFIIGLVVGWFACKLLAGPTSSAGTAVTPLPAPTPEPVPAEAAPVVEANAAPAVAEPAPAQPQASTDAVSEQLQITRGQLESQQAEIKRLETELDAARRNVLAARHSASNHGSTISALRDQVSKLQRELKDALAAAKP